MFRKIAQAGPLVILVALAICVALMAGCSSKSTSNDTPTAQPAALTVTASPSVVEVNATSVVEATVSDGGVGVADEVVYFTAEPPGAGYFTPDTAVTDANGIAATVFTANVTGSVRVDADADLDGVALSKVCCWLTARIRPW